METADLAAGSSLGSAGRAAGREEREQLHGGKGGNRPIHAARCTPFYLELIPAIKHDLILRCQLP